MRGDDNGRWVLAGVFALILGSASLHGAPSIVQLTDPSGRYRIYSADALTPDGKYVVGSLAKKGTQGRVAYRWSKEGAFEIVGDLKGGEVFSIPSGISHDGQVVVGWSKSAKGIEAFGWTKRTGIRGLGDFDGGEFESQANGVSGDGRIIVGLATAEGRSSYRRHGDAFVWTRQDGMKPLGDLGTFRDTSWAGAISADGSTVVGKGSGPEGSEAFRSKGGKMQGLGSLLSGTDFFSEALAVSSDGSIVAGDSGHLNLKREAFVWTEEKGIQGLGRLPGEGKSYARGVSDDGTVVGFCMIDERSHAFVWDPEAGKRLLWDVLTEAGLDPDREGWKTLTNLYAISPDGRHLLGMGRRKERGSSIGGSLFLLTMDR